MKVQMRTLVCGFIIPPLALLFAACGGKESVASKSAAAYAEAKAKGVPAGGEHGGHSAGEQSTSTEVDPSKMSPGDMAGMDHSTMKPGDMAGMDHSNTKSGDKSGMDHSSMKSGDMAGMDHSRMKSGDMAGMDHSNMKSGGIARMDHSNMKAGDMAGMDHSSMSGMNHGDAIPAGGLWGAVPGSLSGGAASLEQPSMAGMNHPPSQPAPSQSRPSGHEGHASSAAAPAPAASVTQMAGLQPQQTLRQDTLDQPAPISVSEVMKSSGSGHDMSTMSEQPQASDAAQDHANHGAPAAVAPAARKATPPSRKSAVVAPSKSAVPRALPKKQVEPATSKDAQVNYTCPMHPEVTSAKPGKCPKCGMDLVKKEKK